MIIVAGTGSSSGDGLQLVCDLLIPGGSVQLGDELVVYGAIYPDNSNASNTGFRVRLGGQDIMRNGAGAGIGELVKRTMFYTNGSTYIFPGLFESAGSSEGDQKLTIDWSNDVTFQLYSEFNDSADSCEFGFLRLSKIV